MASSDRPGRKHFIAGAVCPACGLTDKIYVMRTDTQVTRNCSRCDFVETLEDEDPADPDVQVVKLK